MSAEHNAADHMLIENPKGNYRFIKGRNPFSSGAVADVGYQIVHAAFETVLPLDVGLVLIEEHLHTIGRPMNALSGVELRIPRALSLAEFKAFNVGYVRRLAKWDIRVGDLNPVARTNVAAEVNPVPEPGVFGFSYTVAASHRRPTWVLSGAPEVKVVDGERAVVAPGDLSREGMRQKIAQVLDSLNVLLEEIGATWADATSIGVYTIHDIHPYLENLLLSEVPSASVRGIHWQYARPPIDDTEFEVDVRRVFQELIVPT